MAKRIDKLLKRINTADDINERIISLLTLTIDDITYLNKSEEAKHILPISILTMLNFLGDKNINMNNKIRFIMDYIKMNKTSKTDSRIEGASVLKMEFVNTNMEALNTAEIVE